MRIFLFVLFITSIATATVPTIYEQRNNGFYKFPELLYSINVDCENGTIGMLVMDANFTRIAGANSYLKYIDFSSSLISANSTDEDGFALHNLPGNTSFMRGMFILVIEKKNYRSREIHFDISGCYKPAEMTEPPVEMTIQQPEEKDDPEPVISENSIETAASQDGVQEKDLGNELLLVMVIIPLLIICRSYAKRLMPFLGRE